MFKNHVQTSFLFVLLDENTYACSIHALSIGCCVMGVENEMCSLLLGLTI